MANEQLPLTEEETNTWWSEIDAAERVRKQYEPWWEANLEAYCPKPTKDPKTYGADINTNRDFTLVEQKAAQLFFQTPEVSVKPAPLMQGQEDILLTHQDILNEYLGPDNVNAKHMVREALFDTLCPAGFGVTKMGYESVVVSVAQEIPVPDPMTGAPAVDPATGAPMTITQQVPVPIWERLFWERVTPKKVVIPAGHSSTTYDDAPWLAMRFALTLNEAKLKYQLPEDFEAKAGKDEFRFDHDQNATDEQKSVDGVEIWYRSALKDETVKNPDQLRCLVLIKGLEQPVKHVDSPYQQVDPKTGRLTPTSLKGYPIHILTLRTLADSAYIMSDCSISRPQVNELNKFREQQIKMRDTNIPVRVYNVDVVPPEVKTKLDTADYGAAFIGLPAEFFTSQENIKEIAKATYPRENFTFEEKQDNDIARTHAMDSNQGGTKTDSARTATELQLIQVNSNVRLDAERARVLEWYVKGVTKFSTLVQRFVTVEQASMIVGPERAQAWSQIMSQVPAPLAFTAAPDSAIRVDAAQRRKMALETYAYLRNDPKVNAEAVLKRSVFPALSLDSSSLAPPVQPQPKPPDAMKGIFQVKGEDLNPMMPQYVGVLMMLKAMGVPVEGLPPAQPQPLLAQPNSGIVKPDTGMGPASSGGGSGGMQGTGAPAPIAPGGQGMENAD